MMKKRYTAVFFFLLMCFGLYLFCITYYEAREKAIDELNSRQLILAKQAKVEIESFFNSITGFLAELSTSSHIIEFDEKGKEEMAVALKIRPEGITAITRVDAFGNIVYTTPFNEAAINTNILYQKHVQKIFETHTPVASDVFDAAQGYRAIAVHVPVFKGGEFRGTLAVLIDFPTISKRYLQNIRIGETGYAWMTSREGIELYSPDPGRVGKSVFESCKEFSAVLSMVEKMLRGEQGTTTYDYGKIGDNDSEVIKKQAVFLPVEIVDSYWSIVVSSAEREVLSSLVKFKNKLLAVIGLLLIFSIVFFYYSLKAWMVLKNEEKRKKAEEKIRQLSQFRESVIDNANVWLNVCDESGNIVVWNKAAEGISGYTREEVVGHGKIWEWLYPDEGYRAEIVAKAVQIIQKDVAVSGLETRIQRKDGAERIISWHSRNFKDDRDKIVGSIALGLDITEQKHAEEALKESRRKYKQLVDDVGPSLVIFTHEINGGVTYVSPSIRLVTGLPPEDVTGKHWKDVLEWEPETLRLAENEIKKLKGGQKNTELDMSFVDKDSIRTLHVQFHLIEDKNGELSIEGTAAEITNRKKAELEREKLIQELQSALRDVKTLSGLLPICSNCKKIRNDQGYWDNLETYLEKYSDVSFSHGLCRECANKLYGGQDWFVGTKDGD